LPDPEPPGVVERLRLGFDVVQPADAGQSLVGPGRVGDPGVVELAAGVGPAPDLGRPRRRAVEQRVVLPQGVGLDVPGVVAQPPLRAVAGVRRGEVEHGVRVVGVPQVHPQVPGSGPPGTRVQYRDRGVVRLNDAGLPNQLRHPVDERLQHAGRGGDPPADGGPGDIDSVPGQDASLAVQGEVVGELGHHHMGDQAGSRQSLPDRLGR